MKHKMPSMKFQGFGFHYEKIRNKKYNSCYNCTKCNTESWLCSINGSFIRDLGSDFWKYCKNYSPISENEGPGVTTQSNKDKSTKSAKKKTSDGILSIGKVNKR
jgi:hypothetical protein